MSSSSQAAERRNILEAAGIVGSATVASRVLGLARDAVLAFLFGATPAADAFFVAFRIPNLMRQLFGEGALAASFVPVYTDIRDKQGEAGASSFAQGMFSLLFVILLVITAAGVLFAPGLVRIIAWGFDPGSQVFELTVLLTRWMFPYVIFICMAAMAMGLLNARGHFFAPAIAPALLNLSMISFALLLAGRASRPIVAVAWGVLMGGVLQLLAQVPPMRKMKVIPAPKWPSLSPEIRRMMILMGPAALGVAVYQVNMLVDTLIASFLPGGSISYLWYGNRMMQFPLGVFGIALATAALPTLSQQAAQGRDDDFVNTISFSLSLTVFIGFPAAAGLIALKKPIMATLFARGAFGAAEVSGAARALLYYAAGLPFIIGVKILGRAFFALENTRTPFAAAATALISNIGLNLLLMGPMAHAGLALATSLAAAINFSYLSFFMLRARGSRWLAGGLPAETVKSAAAAAVMLAVVSLLAAELNWMSAPLGSRVLALLGCVAGGITVYLLTALLLGCNGVKTLKNKLRHPGV